METRDILVVSCERVPNSSTVYGSEGQQKVFVSKVASKFPLWACDRSQTDTKKNVLVSIPDCLSEICDEGRQQQ